MDKLQLIKHIAGSRPQLNTKKTECTVRVILDALCGTLAKGGRVEIRGFGSFSLNQRPAKLKRNSISGSRPKEAAKYVPYFKPSKELCARVSKSKGAGTAEITSPQQISSDLLSHGAANDTELAEIYA